MPASHRHDDFLRAARRVSRRDLGRLMATAAAAACAPAAVGVAASIDAGGSAVAGAPIRIGSNENNHGLGPSALAAVREALPEANRYGGEGIGRLIASLSELHGIGRESIVITPGSGEILRAATVAFTSSSRALVVAAPTFEAPGRTAESLGAPVRAVPVLASGSLDLAGMAAQADGAGLFFVCNPNNPTGGVSTADAINDFVARVRRVAPEAVLLMDEAYHDYVDDPGYASAIALVRSDPRILVSRTFSKIYGMAGMRVGYAIGQPATLGAMRRVMSQGTLSNVSVGAALASLADRDHHARQRTLNRESKAFTRKALEDAGFRVLPSEANFVMVDVRRHAGSFAAACREVGVFIARPFPPLDRHARISIGTMDEMQRAMAAILPILASPSSAHRDDIVWDTAGC